MNGVTPMNEIITVCTKAALQAGALLKSNFGIRMLGTSVRQLTYLAEGVLNGIIKFDDHPWDFAAECVL